MQNIAFEQIYKNAPQDRVDQLQHFRSTHPPKRIKVNGIDWEYVASGQGPEAILILGGALSVGETAFKTITRLESRCRVISPSYPAAGRMSAITEGLAAILDAEGIAQVHVFGHSLGAAAAHIFARQYTERVNRLVLDGFGLYTPGHVLLAKIFFKLPFRWLIAYYRRAIDRLTVSGSDPETAFWKAYMVELLTSQPRAALEAQFRVLIDVFDRAGEYGVFRPFEKPGRVLLILARDDRGFSQVEREALIASYPGAQVHWFSSGGHLSGFTHPDEFNRVLDGFLLGEITMHRADDNHAV